MSALAKKKPKKDLVKEKADRLTDGQHVKIRLATGTFSDIFVVALSKVLVTEQHRTPYHEILEIIG